jgi:hypothetical protein
MNTVGTYTDNAYPGWTLHLVPYYEHESSVIREFSRHLAEDDSIRPLIPPSVLEHEAPMQFCFTITYDGEEQPGFQDAVMNSLKLFGSLYHSINETCNRSFNRIHVYDGKNDKAGGVLVNTIDNYRNFMEYLNDIQKFADELQQVHTVNADYRNEFNVMVDNFRMFQLSIQESMDKMKQAKDIDGYYHAVYDLISSHVDLRLKAYRVLLDEYTAPRTTLSSDYKNAIESLKSARQHEIVRLEQTEEPSC